MPPCLPQIDQPNIGSPAVSLDACTAKEFVSVYQVMGHKDAVVSRLGSGTRTALLAAGFVLISISALLASTEPMTNKAPDIQLASLGRSDAAPAKRSRLSGGAVQWGASPSCLDSRLRTVINQVASNFGPVRVNSTCRSHSHNAKVGGATGSKHLTGDAANFSISRNKPAVLGWLRRQPSVGGLKLYAGGRGHFHIDTGPRRTW